MIAEFSELEIKGLLIARAQIYTDPRGWLIETFRADWIKNPDGLPVMGYISMTLPGIIRGPHEHRFQTDWFAFVGPSDFRIFLWDNRPDSVSFNTHLQLQLGEQNPALLIVPPGVVHAYKNIGDKPGIVYNYPNRLYRGINRGEEPDEIRYENDPRTRFRVE